MQRLRTGHNICTARRQAGLSRQTILILDPLPMRAGNSLAFRLSPHLSVRLDPDHAQRSLCPDSGGLTRSTSKVHHHWRLLAMSQLDADIQENTWGMRTNLIVQCSLSTPDIDGFRHAGVLSFCEGCAASWRFAT